MARELFSNKPKKSASFSPQQVPSRMGCIPLLQDRLCAPPALSMGGLTQIPWAREGAAPPKVVQWGWGAEDGAGMPGKRRTHMLRVFRLKWFLICLAE